MKKNKKLPQVSIKRIDKWFHKIAWLVVVGTALILLGLSYWLYWPYKVVEVKNSPYPILNANKQVEVGTLLKHQVEYCKYVDLQSTTTRQFVNNLIFTMPDTVQNNELGCHTIVANTLVPMELPPGKYYLRIIKNYKVNPIRTITETFRTEEFEVVE